MEITAPFSVLLSAAADSVSSSPSAASTAIVDMPSTAQFAQIMAAPAQAEPSSTAPAAVVANASAAPASYQLGDAILAGMQDLSAGANSALADINRSLASNEALSASVLLKLQMSLIEFALTHSYTGAVISTLTDDIDTLVKLQ